LKSHRCLAHTPDVAIRIFRYFQAPHFILTYLIKKQHQKTTTCPVQISFLHSRKQYTTMLAKCSYYTIETV
ncbi:hypothetical protein ABEW03_21045, partial [Virgibacillus pantothenticus]|uniref:hypothetical protein n=1 Tax=Virgibacillus pantothenticus TaxID=1473 RepID=UPI003D266863